VENDPPQRGHAPSVRVDWLVIAGEFTTLATTATQNNATTNVSCKTVVDKKKNNSCGSGATLWGILGSDKLLSVWKIVHLQDFFAHSSDAAFV
jgi:hypothetical protein